MIAYHMSVAAHPVGRILTGNGRPKVEPTIEDALERFRPKSCLRRLDSVYSREVADFRMLGLDSGYIYTVTPLGDCQRHDARWVGLLQQAYLKPKLKEKFPLGGVKHWPDWTDDYVRSASIKYWTGVESSEPLWEILSAEAEVKARLSEFQINVGATKGGWQPS